MVGPKPHSQKNTARYPRNRIRDFGDHRNVRSNQSVTVLASFSIGHIKIYRCVKTDLNRQIFIIPSYRSIGRCDFDTENRFERFNNTFDRTNFSAYIFDKTLNDVSAGYVYLHFQSQIPIKAVCRIYRSQDEELVTVFKIHIA